MRKGKIREDIREKLDYLDSLLEEINPKETRKWLSKFKHKSASIDKPTKPKGKKITRAPQWEMFELAYNLLTNRKIRDLIFLKNYISRTDTDNDDLYILSFFGIPSKERENPEVKELTKNINNSIISTINFLQSMLGWIPLTAKKKPEIKKWVIDIFGEDAKYYLTDWEKCKRKSHNIPDHDKSLKKVLDFLKGIPSTKLYGKEIKTYVNFFGKRHVTIKKRVNYDIFYRRQGPQGQIKILYAIHCLLDWPRIEKQLIQEKTDLVKEILKDTPPHICQKVLSNLSDR